MSFSVSAQEKYDINEMNSLINKLSSEVKTIRSEAEDNKRKVVFLSQKIDAQNVIIDSLSSISSSNTKRIEDAVDIMGKDMGNTKRMLSDNIEAMNSDINNKTLWAGIVGFLALMSSLFIFLHHKKQSNSHNKSLLSFEERIKAFKEEQASIEERLANYDSKLVDAIEKQMALSINHSKDNNSEELDHSLVITIANEMARIQQNLNHMDEHVRGVSQLKNRVKAIMTTLNSKQYEITDLLGKSYHEGDNMIATMEYNENLEVGTNRIKRVIKPQVSYAGKIIQQAEVVVEYNE